jgi:hypothetical protein
MIYKKKENLSNVVQVVLGQYSSYLKEFIKERQLAHCVGFFLVIEEQIGDKSFS